MINVEELRTKLFVLINQAEALPEGPGKSMTLIQMKSVIQAIDSVVKRQEAWAVTDDKRPIPEEIGSSLKH